MCGIAGYVVRRGVADPGVVHRQLREEAHRGPDAFGVYDAGRGAIGQSRLSIIDLVTGDPPISTPDGAIGAVQNGEIYGYAAIREELLAAGHVLQTTGDTEVIAHLAERLSPVELASRLDGMFAFAVWDGRRLVLGRDRVGKKPLHWWTDGEHLVFASEIKSLLVHPSVTADLDEDAIPAYLTFGYVPSPRTIYRGIHSLPPGHVLVLDEDFRIEITRYWRPTAPGAGGASRLDVSMDEAASLVRASLAAAVQRRLVSDVPVGAFLSGGIDSSVVVALMAEAMSEPVRTFTIGFDDRDGFDERPYARLVAERYHTDHTEFVVQPHAVDLIEKLVWHHDQPFGDSSAIPTYLLSELTKQHVTVALCGDGGDELFAGYERFAAGVVARRAAIAPPLVRLLGAAARRAGVGKVARFSEQAARGLPDAFRAWISYVPDDLVDELSPGTSRWALDDYQRIWDETAGAATLDRLLLLNIRTYLLDDLLPKVDRTSMAHGLEVRAPLLDHELLELAMRLPTRHKQRGMRLKRVLKATAADLLPPELLHRGKRGFGVPLDRWFRTDLDAYVTSHLGASDARVRAHLAGTAVDRVLSEHRSGARNHGHALWTLLTLEVFLRKQGW